jgi:hypothetical protein
MKYLFPALALASGCATTDVSTTELTSADLRPARVVATDVSIREIAHTQCAQAQACGAITSRGIYRDGDYCENDITRAVEDDLRTERCTYVDAAVLRVCVDAIRHESCAQMNFTENPPPPCRRAALCR